MSRLAKDEARWPCLSQVLDSSRWFFALWQINYAYCQISWFWRNELAGCLDGCCQLLVRLELFSSLNCVDWARQKQPMVWFENQSKLWAKASDQGSGHLRFKWRHLANPKFWQPFWVSSYNLSSVIDGYISESFKSLIYLVLGQEILTADSGSRCWSKVLEASWLWNWNMEHTNWLVCKLKQGLAPTYCRGRALCSGISRFEACQNQRVWQAWCERAERYRPRMLWLAWLDEKLPSQIGRGLKLDSLFRHLFLRSLAVPSSYRIIRIIRIVSYKLPPSVCSTR